MPARFQTTAPRLNRHDAHIQRAIHVEPRLFVGSNRLREIIRRKEIAAAVACLCSEIRVDGKVRLIDLLVYVASLPVPRFVNDAELILFAMLAQIFHQAA